MIFRRLLGVIIKPRETFAEIGENPSIWQSIIVMVGISLFSTLIVFNKDYFINTLGQGADPFTINQMMSLMPMFMSFGIFASMILTPIFHFIGVGIYSLLCEFFGYSGNGKGLFSNLAFTSVPGIFSTIVYRILIAFNLQVISIIFSFGFWIWVIVLKIFAIKETYKMDGGKATLIYFIPLITMVVVIGIIILLSMVSLFPIIESFSNSIGVQI